MYVLFIIIYLPLATHAVNFKQCLADYNAGVLKYPDNTTITTGGVHRNESFAPIGTITNPGTATGLMFETCEVGCGRTQESFDLGVFSKQFAAWLLPWLALTSQLPFGAKLRKHNIVAVLLTIGSPTLAAYSLMLTVLNAHYLAQRFSSYTYPNAYYAVRILSGLQQSALRVITEHGLLESLVVLPQNDKWWVNMARSIDYEHTWSIPALANLTWVIAAYFFTVAESFSDVTVSINSNGQGVGSLWLWLLPIVIGWLQISPKCDYDRLQAALSETNKGAYIATRNGDGTRNVATEAEVGALHAFMFEEYDVFSPSFDNAITSPIFNYSRLFTWMICVERVAEAFEAASARAQNKLTVDKTEWKQVEESHSEKIHVDNRKGSVCQVIEYCSPPEAMVRHRSHWLSKVVRRIIAASAVALALQWATTGSAIFIVWFTPTTKLGCRSTAYLLYGAISTLVWMMVVVSSILSYCAIDHDTLRYSPHEATIYQRIACKLAVIINSAAKILAALNSILIIVACVFQFTNVFSTCYCNSSVIGRGRSKAYFTVNILPEEKGEIAHAWAGGVAMSAVTSFLFTGLVQIFLDTPGPPA